MTEQQWIAPGEHGFLNGETLYLRPIEIGDAKYPEAWHDSPFPINPQRAEELLTKNIPEEPEKRKHRLVACRKSDDIPVGSVIYETWHTMYCHVRVHVDPTLDDAQAAAIKGEMLSIFVPWRIHECHNMVVWVELDAPHPALITAVTTIGMRPAVKFREAVWHRGARRDQWVYEMIHPAWIERLGDPGPMIDLATDPPEAVPHVRRVSLTDPQGPIPDNALLVSERIALRPMRADDWKDATRLLRRETETFFDNGRWLPNHLAAGRWVDENVKADPPRFIEFTAILRETGAIVGDLILLDVNFFHGTAETGSAIFEPQYRGIGLGTEAKLLLLEYAFDYLGLHMVRSYVWGPNTRSQAALRKQGYRDAGGFRWQSTVGADFVDTRTFDLLASEWRARVGPPSGGGDSL